MHTACRSGCVHTDPPVVIQGDPSPEDIPLHEIDPPLEDDRVERRCKVHVHPFRRIGAAESLQLASHRRSVVTQFPETVEGLQPLLGRGKRPPRDIRSLPCGRGPDPSVLQPERFHLRTRVLRIGPVEGTSGGVCLEGEHPEGRCRVAGPDGLVWHPGFPRCRLHGRLDVRCPLRYDVHALPSVHADHREAPAFGSDVPFTIPLRGRWKTGTPSLHRTDKRPVPFREVIHRFRHDRLRDGEPLPGEPSGEEGREAGVPAHRRRPPDGLLIGVRGEQCGQGSRKDLGRGGTGRSVSDAELPRGGLNDRSREVRPHLRRVAVRIIPGLAEQVA